LAAAVVAVAAAAVAPAVRLAVMCRHLPVAM
jgi:hypothetical protein